MKTLKVLMIKEWNGWLKAGQEYELDYHLATLLMQLRKAKFNGDAIDLFQGFDNNTADSQGKEDDLIWPT